MSTIPSPFRTTACVAALACALLVQGCGGGDDETVAADASDAVDGNTSLPPPRACIAGRAQAAQPLRAMCDSEGGVPLRP